MLLIATNRRYGCNFITEGEGARDYITGEFKARKTLIVIWTQ